MMEGYVVLPDEDEKKPGDGADGSAEGGGDKKKKEESPVDVQADRTIKNYVIGSVALGSVPVPLIDLVGLSVLQARMIKKLCEIHGHDCSEDEAKIWVSAITGGYVATILGPGIMSLFKFIPGLGSWRGAMGVAAMGGATTYALGRLFNKHFKGGGTPENVDTDQMKSEMDEEVKEGGEYVAQQQADQTKDDAEAKDTKVKTEKSKGVKEKADDGKTAKAKTPQAKEGKPKAAEKKEAKPKAKAKDANPEGKKPAAANAGKDDDLSLILGVGPAVRNQLHEAGIDTCKQLAEANEDQLKEVISKVGGRNRYVDARLLIEQADLLAKGDRAGFDAYVENLKKK